MTTGDNLPHTHEATVLIADNEEAICYTLAREVRRLELTLLVAADGLHAVELESLTPPFSPPCWTC